VRFIVNLEGNPQGEIVMHRRAKHVIVPAGLLGFIAADAGAQSYNDPLSRKDQIQQQRADSERMKAEAERIKAETEAKSAEARENQASKGTSTSRYGVTRYVVANGGDDFAGKRVPKYRLPNGVTLQASGEFHPDKDVVCISHCPPNER
jgi:hypothetical protein